MVLATHDSVSAASFAVAVLLLWLPVGWVCVGAVDRVVVM